MNNAQSKTRLKRSGSPLGQTSATGQSREASGNGHGRGPIVITGGAGFIGTNLAHRLLSEGKRVILYDNLSRAGVEQNLAWLQATHGDRVRHERGDVRDFQALRRTIKGASQVFHFAAQVAVTTSLEEPIEDFEINARGTLNLLEAMRSLEEPPSLLFTSTNKVYGDLSEVKLRNFHNRYEPREESVRAYGFSEQCPLHFHSPYGCSKGAACQYVLDYARTFGLRTAVFRMSCIYGPHQFGTEDQGWVAHFLIKALGNAPLTIYGDGRQVRDILFVEDLVEAFLLAQERIEDIQGQVFNIGGGPANTTSLLELMELIGELHGRRPAVHFADWRPADQQYYVSDTRKFAAATGWAPKVSVREGVKQLYQWLQEIHPGAPAARALRLNGQGKHRNGEVLRVATRAIRPRTVAHRKSLPLRGLSGRNGSAKQRKLAKAI